MKTLKKTSGFVLISALIFSWFSLFIPTQAQAACVWAEETVFFKDGAVQRTGGCSNIQNKSEDSDCTDKKPTYVQGSEVGRLAVCCCDKNATAQNTSSSICDWEKQSRYYDTTTRQTITTSCSSGKSVFTENNCTTTKPNYPAENGSAVTAICCCQSNAITQTSTNSNQNTPKYEIPELQVKIPGLTFSDVVCTNKGDGSFVCSVAWIGDYVSGIYSYALGIGGILAAVMLMAGGVLWLISGGDTSRISKAKTLITGSITGLIILFTSYTLLYQINPELTVFKPIMIRSIGNKTIVGDSNIPIDDGQMRTGLDLFKHLTGLTCNGESVVDITKKAAGKVTYSQSKRMTAGPDNTIYLDCSSYANLVSICAGLGSVPTYTGSLFEGMPEYTSLNDLKPGDLIGWKPVSAGGQKPAGHVLIYLGNDRFADVHGPEERAGKAVGNNLHIAYILKTSKRDSDGKVYVRKAQ